MTTVIGEDRGHDLTCGHLLPSMTIASDLSSVQGSGKQ
jgi:hypothetical protein